MSRHTGQNLKWMDMGVDDLRVVVRPNYKILTLEILSIGQRLACSTRSFLFLDFLSAKIITPATLHR